MSEIVLLVQGHWPLLIVWCMMITCAAYCHISMKLSNLVTFPLMLAGLALGTIHDGGGHPDGGTGGILASGACLLLASVMLIPLYATEGFPVGAVKMQMGFAACVGAFYGLLQGLTIVFVSTVLSVGFVAIILKAKSDEHRALGLKGTYEMPFGFIMTFAAVWSVLSLKLLVF
jgi:hypothetical protein